jgi:hypothetical protein
MIDRRALASFALACVQLGCPRPEGSSEVSSTTKATAGTKEASTIAPANAEPAKTIATASATSDEPPQNEPKDPDPIATYKWLSDEKVAAYPPRVDSLRARFPAPPGFSRVPVEEGSFGAFLRTLPLAAPGTPVVSYKGGVIHPGDDPNIAAVIAIDIGTADLQQCADTIVRAHAEWLFSQGRHDMTYRAASGVMMPFDKWLAGERPKSSGMSITWTKSAAPAQPTHAVLRAYLDSVFSWANTVALGVQAKPIAFSEIAPGDFVVAGGNPGHAVIILDVAQSKDGKKVALLGQGYMPAQSFQVLRPNATTTWFPLDEASGALTTPYWEPFPWKTLRRLATP